MACAGASQVLFLAKSMRLALVLLMNRVHEATAEKHQIFVVGFFNVAVNVFSAHD
jgi:hypothetical protein